MVVTPVTAPSSIVAVPSVILPPVTAPEAVTFVNPPSFGVTDPITVLFIIPSVILKFSAIYRSWMTEAFHVPPVRIPTLSISVLLPLVNKVPLTSGILITRSSVGSVIDNFVS